MTPAQLRTAFLAFVLLVAGPLRAENGLPVAELKRTTPVDFGREVVPFLRKNCFACHNEKKAWREYELAIKSGAERDPKKPRSKKGGSPLAIFCVYIYLIAGTVYFFISNYFNFAKILR